MYARHGDVVYVHGAQAYRMLRTASGPAGVCLTVTLLVSFNAVGIPQEGMQGKRLFRDGGPAANVRLVDSRTSASGLVMLTYEPAEG
jgi:hypothetical protein